MSTSVCIGQHQFNWWAINQTLLEIRDFEGKLRNVAVLNQFVAQASIASGSKSNPRTFLKPSADAETQALRTTTGKGSISDLSAPSR